MTQPKSKSLHVQFLSPTQVRPYGNNPRVISQDAIDKVAASINAFGFNVPIVVDAQRVIVTGHTRLAAALKLGLDRVPVIVAAHLTEEQARAYRIADNRVAEESQWDDAKLSEEIAALESAAQDIEVLGFSDEEMERILADDGDAGRATPIGDPQSLKMPTMFEVVVSCQTESEQADLYTRMTKEGFQCRVLSM